MRGALALALVLGGCNAIFGLDPTSLGPDAHGGGSDAARGRDGGPCVPVGHDEDGDGLDDACDRCPYIASFTDPDSDGDGVGDDCDPHPGSPDHFVSFDPLDSPDLAYTPYRGAWLADANGLHQTATEGTTATFAILTDLVPGDAVVDVGIRIDVLSPDVPTQEVSVWTDATGGGAATEPDGYQSALNRGVPPNIELSAWQSQVPTIAPSVNATGNYGAGERWRIRTERAGVETIETATYLAVSTSATTEISDASFDAGAIGFRSLGTAFTVEYVAVIAPG